MKTDIEKLKKCVFYLAMLSQENLRYLHKRVDLTTDYDIEKRVKAILEEPEEEEPPKSEYIECKTGGRCYNHCVRKEPSLSDKLEAIISFCWEQPTTEGDFEGGELEALNNLYKQIK